MPEAADELYGLDPGAFTAARDALAKALRAGGDREAADQVKQLRRPPVTVWALNQVARHDPSLINDVIAAGAGLRAATDRAVTGDASAMRAAKSAERSAIDAAVTAAARYLEDAGHPAGPTARQRMEATLHAAEVDDTVGARLAAGTLDRDRDAPGLGLELSDWPDLSPATDPGGPATDDGARAGGSADGGGGAPVAADQPIAEQGAAPTAAPETPPAEVRPPAGPAGNGEADDGRAEAERRRQAKAHLSDLEDQADRLAGRAARLVAAAEAAERRAAEARATADQAEAAATEARAAADRAGATAAAANEEMARARAALG